jgi:outer membrane protein TolC
VLNSRQSLDSAEMNLRRLLGQGDAAAVEQALLVDQMPTAAVPAPQAFSPWIRTVADFDFGTAIQLSNIIQADAAVAQAEQNDHPRLNLSVGSSRYGNGTTGGGVSGGYESYRQRSGWNNYAELRLSFPLGFRESEANLRSATRARRQAELRLADTRQSLVFGARASWRELEAARARVDASTSSLELQRKSYEGERARYDAGQSDVLRVLQAQAALDSAQLNWVQSHLDARAASAKVARLDGSILPRHGFTMDAVEQKIGASLGSEDPLPPLTVTP